MKESHRKGVTSYRDPESCAVSRKAEREALTRVRDGTMPTEALNVSVRRTLRSQRPVGFMESPRARTGRARGQERCRMREKARLKSEIPATGNPVRPPQ